MNTLSAHTARRSEQLHARPRLAAGYAPCDEPAPAGAQPPAHHPGPRLGDAGPGARGCGQRVGRSGAERGKAWRCRPVPLVMEPWQPGAGPVRFDWCAEPEARSRRPADWPRGGDTVARLGVRWAGRSGVRALCAGCSATASPRAGGPAAHALNPTHEDRLPRVRRFGLRRPPRLPAPTAPRQHECRRFERFVGGVK